MPADSSRLIKARVARNLSSATAFNYDDLRRQCEEYLEEARRKGQSLLAEAAAQANEARQRAREEGHAAGQREGLAAAGELIESRAADIAAQKTQEQLRTLLPAFQAAVRALEIERDRWLAAWEGAAVRLASAIAEKIVREELAHRPELALGTIREALELAAGQPHIEVRLNPSDLELVNGCGEEAIERLSKLGQAQLVGDETVSRGGCLIETRHGVIDARLETQLARIEQELLEGNDS
jgi:flagellar assembly protein FliH